MRNVSKTRRLLHLIELLQSGRTYNTRELSELTDIGRRQVFRDLKTLQDSGVPVLYDAERRGYWLSQSSYVPHANLTLDETLSLVVLAHDLGRLHEGIPFQQTARDAALKLLGNLPSHLRARIGEMTQAIDIRADSHHALACSRACYDALLSAIRDRRRIRIQYRSLADRREIGTLLSPYRLLFLRRAWYVIGRSSVHRAVRTFHLGRIAHAEITHESYVIPPRFTLERYLGNAWHLICERGARAEIRIRFSSKVAHNVAEVTWHKTQRVKFHDDGSIDFRVTVDGLREISWWVLGYGAEAEVLEPPELREIISDHVQRMLQLYQTARPRPPRRRSSRPARHKTTGS